MTSVLYANTTTVVGISSAPISVTSVIFVFIAIMFVIAILIMRFFTKNKYIIFTMLSFVALIAQLLYSPYEYSYQVVNGTVVQYQFYYNNVGMVSLLDTGFGLLFLISVVLLLWNILGKVKDVGSGDYVDL